MLLLLGLANICIHFEVQSNTRHFFEVHAKGFQKNLGASLKYGHIFQYLASKFSIADGPIYR